MCVNVPRRVYTVACAIQVYKFEHCTLPVEETYTVQVNHTYPKPGIRPKNCQNFLFPSHLEELATFRTH